MTTVVVGGHARNVGKTSLVTAIINAWSQQIWTAVKLSSHWHHEKEPSRDAKEVLRIKEEFTLDNRTDTGRYLSAGAARSFWIRVRNGKLSEAMPKMAPVLHSSQFVIIESNGIAQYVQPDLFLMVHKYDVEDYKESALSVLPYAHAIVAINRECGDPAWKKIVISSVPVFSLSGLFDLSPELIEFLAQKLGPIPAKR